MTALNVYCPSCNAEQSDPHSFVNEAEPEGQTVFVETCDECGEGYAVEVTIYVAARGLYEGEEVAA